MNQVTSRIYTKEIILLIDILSILILHYNRRASWKVFSLAYNWHETRDKRPWVGTQIGARVTTTLLKVFLVTANGSMDVSGSTLTCCCWCPWSHGLRPKKLSTNVAVTTAPVLVPTQQLLVPSFTSVVGWIENFSPCLCILYW